ncbi:hypothetical protein TRVL_07668 [Trypanosoma vivax]|nr:hypothetical protein TRVL_07668 [Trypanosoma vivax]
MEVAQRLSFEVALRKAYELSRWTSVCCEQRARSMSAWIGSCASSPLRIRHKTKQKCWSDVFCARRQEGSLTVLKGQLVNIQFSRRRLCSAPAQAAAHAAVLVTQP